MRPRAPRPSRPSRGRGRRRGPSWRRPAEPWRSTRRRGVWPPGPAPEPDRRAAELPRNPPVWRTARPEAAAERPRRRGGVPALAFGAAPRHFNLGHVEPVLPHLPALCVLKDVVLNQDVGREVRPAPRCSLRKRRSRPGGRGRPGAWRSRKVLFLTTIPRPESTMPRPPGEERVILGEKRGRARRREKHVVALHGCRHRVPEAHRGVTKVPASGCDQSVGPPDLLQRRPASRNWTSSRPGTLAPRGSSPARSRRRTCRSGGPRRARRAR